MIITTTENIPGKKYEVLGIVKGCIVHSKNIGADIGASLKTLVGGEIHSYTDMIEEAREKAEERMKEQASRLGADGIVCVRYATSSVMQGASEIFAYGTAVKFID